MNHYLMLLLTKGYQSTIIQLVQYNKGSTINIYESPQHNFVCQKGAMPLNFVFVAVPAIQMQSIIKMLTSHKKNTKWLIFLCFFNYCLGEVLKLKSGNKADSFYPGTQNMAYIMHPAYLVWYGLKQMFIEIVNGLHYSMVVSSELLM